MGMHTSFCGFNCSFDHILPIGVCKVPKWCNQVRLRRRDHLWSSDVFSVGSFVSTPFHVHPFYMDTSEYRLLFFWSFVIPYILSSRSCVLILSLPVAFPLDRYLATGIWLFCDLCRWRSIDVQRFHISNSWKCMDQCLVVIEIVVLIDYSFFLSFFRFLIGNGGHSIGYNTLQDDADFRRGHRSSTRT